MTLNTESTEESVVTPEVVTEGVVQNTEDVAAETPEVVEETDTVPEFTQILDKIFEEFEKDLETQKTNTESESFWPKISEPVHDSEAKVLLENLQKELDEIKNSEQEVSAKNADLISELESIKTEKEALAAETQKQKSDIETMEEFYDTLIKIPVLWELVQIVSTQWPDAVNIPQYLKEIMEAKMLAQTVNPSNESTVTEEKKHWPSSFEAAIARRNKR